MPAGILLLTALALLLAACGGNAAPDSIADVAPLDEDRPTFIFFYTDT